MIIISAQVHMILGVVQFWNNQLDKAMQSGYHVFITNQDMAKITRGTII